MHTQINKFTRKVEARTRLLRVAADFFAYYVEIMEYYAELEQRDTQIRIVAQTQQRAEQNKEEFQHANANCERAHETIITKANQLLDELTEQKTLLEIQNDDTIGVVQALINTIRKSLF